MFLDLLISGNINPEKNKYMLSMATGKKYRIEVIDGQYYFEPCDIGYDKVNIKEGIAKREAEKKLSDLACDELDKESRQMKYNELPECDRALFDEMLKWYDINDFKTGNKYFSSAYSEKSYLIIVKDNDYYFEELGRIPESVTDKTEKIIIDLIAKSANKLPVHLKNHTSVLFLDTTNFNLSIVIDFNDGTITKYNSFTEN